MSTAFVCLFSSVKVTGSFLEIVFRLLFIIRIVYIMKEVNIWREGFQQAFVLIGKTYNLVIMTSFGNNKGTGLLAK